MKFIEPQLSMKRGETMDLSELANNKQLTTEDRCVRYLEKMRWPDGVSCPQCGNKSVSSFQTTGKSGRPRHLYQCLDKACRYQFSPTTGTIFHDSHLPLSKWFSAIALVGDAKEPMSTNQLRLALGVQYKTAAHIRGRISQAMASGNIELVEAPLPETAIPERAREYKHTRKASSQSPVRQPAAIGTPVVSLPARREESSGSLVERTRPRTGSLSPTAVDNVLSMFVSMAQITVQPPLFFVNYLKDKVFT